MNKTISISLLGSNQIYQEQLADFLNNQAAFRVTTIAKNASDFLKSFATSLVDVAILSLETPIVSTIKTVESIRTKYGQGITIIISNATHHSFINGHFEKAGANFLLDKTASSKNLIDAVLGCYVPETFSPFMVSQFSERDFELTKREAEICGFLCKGKSCPEIASTLFLSIRTVENHKANIFRKMEVGSCTQMMEKAIIGGYYFI